MSGWFRFQCSNKNFKIVQRTQHSIFTQKRVTNIWTGTNHHHQMKWISLIYFILFYFNLDMDGTKENCSKKQVTLFRWTFFQK